MALNDCDDLIENLNFCQYSLQPRVLPSRCSIDVRQRLATSCGIIVELCSEPHCQLLLQAHAFYNRSSPLLLNRILFGAPKKQPILHSYISVPAICLYALIAKHRLFCRHKVKTSWLPTTDLLKRLEYSLAHSEHIR